MTNQPLIVHHLSRPLDTAVKAGTGTQSEVEEWGALFGGAGALAPTGTGTGTGTAPALERPPTHLPNAYWGLHLHATVEWTETAPQ